MIFHTTFASDESNYRIIEEERLTDTLSKIEVYLTKTDLGFMDIENFISSSQLPQVLELGIEFSSWHETITSFEKIRVLNEIYTLSRQNDDFEYEVEIEIEDGEETADVYIVLDKKARDLLVKSKIQHCMWDISFLLIPLVKEHLHVKSSYALELTFVKELGTGDSEEKAWVLSRLGNLTRLPSTGNINHKLPFPNPKNLRKVDSPTFNVPDLRIEIPINNSSYYSATCETKDGCDGSCAQKIDEIRNATVFILSYTPLVGKSNNAPLSWDGKKLISIYEESELNYDTWERADHACSGTQIRSLNSFHERKTKVSSEYVYILTALHCIVNNATYERVGTFRTLEKKKTFNLNRQLVIFWNYRMSECTEDHNSKLLDFPKYFFYKGDGSVLKTHPMSNGSDIQLSFSPEVELIAGHVPSDIALLKVKLPVPLNYNVPTELGWDIMAEDVYTHYVAHPEKHTQSFTSFFQFSQTEEDKRDYIDERVGLYLETSFDPESRCKSCSEVQEPSFSLLDIKQNNIITLLDKGIASNGSSGSSSVTSDAKIVGVKSGSLDSLHQKENDEKKVEINSSSKKCKGDDGNDCFVIHADGDLSCAWPVIQKYLGLKDFADAGNISIDPFQRIWKNYYLVP